MASETIQARSRKSDVDGTYTVAAKETFKGSPGRVQAELRVFAAVWEAKGYIVELL